MKLTILSEEEAIREPGFLAEHGLSILIEGDKKILFDVGHSDVFLKNAELMKKNLKNLDIIAISHGHWDHADGLSYLKGNKVLIHPGAFVDRHRASGMYIGMPFSLEKMKKRFKVMLTKEPYKITDNIVFLGEIPRNNNFEAKKTKFYMVKNGKKIPDFTVDDSALAIKTKKGLVVISGCGHSGICNTLEYAKKVCKCKEIYMVIGGFHLFEDKTVVKKTINYLKKNKVKNIYPMHCVGLPVLSRFYQEFKIKKLCAGDTLEI